MNVGPASEKRKYTESRGEMWGLVLPREEKSG